MDSTNFGKDYAISKIFRNKNIEKEEPHNEAPLAFTISESIFLFQKKGSEKSSDSVDFYCNVVKFEISRIALNQGFYRLLTCIECLLHLSKNHVFA